jgi:hypothetical protein
VFSQNSDRWRCRKKIRGNAWGNSRQDSARLRKQHSSQRTELHFTTSARPRAPRNTVLSCLGLAIRPRDAGPCRPNISSMSAQCVITPTQNPGRALAGLLSRAGRLSCHVTQPQPSCYLEKLSRRSRFQRCWGSPVLHPGLRVVETARSTCISISPVLGIWGIETWISRALIPNKGTARVNIKQR